MAITKYSDMSCHVEPNGIVKFSETLITDEYSLKVSAESDKHGNITNGEWTQTDDKGTYLSFTYPDGKISGRYAEALPKPSAGDLAEAMRENRGDLLMKKVEDCRTASNLSLLF